MISELFKGFTYEDMVGFNVSLTEQCVCVCVCVCVWGGGGFNVLLTVQCVCVCVCVYYNV